MFALIVCCDCVFVCLSVGCYPVCLFVRLLACLFVVFGCCRLSVCLLACLFVFACLHACLCVCVFSACLLVRLYVCLFGFFLSLSLFLFLVIDGSLVNNMNGTNNKNNLLILTHHLLVAHRGKYNQSLLAVSRTCEIIAVNASWRSAQLDTAQTACRLT